MALKTVEPEKKKLHTTGNTTVRAKTGGIRTTGSESNTSDTGGKVIHTSRRLLPSDDGSREVGEQVKPKSKVLHTAGRAGLDAMEKNAEGGEELRESADVLASIAASRKLVFRDRRQRQMARDKTGIKTKIAEKKAQASGTPIGSGLKTKEKKHNSGKKVKKKTGKRRRSSGKSHGGSIKGRMLSAFQTKEEDEATATGLKRAAKGANIIRKILTIIIAKIFALLTPVIAAIAAVVAIIACIVGVFLFILYHSPLAIFFPMPDTGYDDPRTVLSGYYQEFNADIAKREDDGDVVTYQNEKDGVPVINFKDTLYVYMVLYSDGVTGYAMDDEAKDHMKEIFDEMNYIEETEVEKEVKAGDSLGEVFVTAYCPCQACSGPHGWATASGKKARAKHTVAVDYKDPIVPMGTKVLIDGTEYTVEDTGDLKKNGNSFDIFFEKHSQTEKFGRKKLKVYLSGGKGSSDDENGDSGDDNVSGTDGDEKTETVKGDGIIVHNLTIEDYIANHPELNDNQKKLLRDMINDKTIYYGGGGLGGAAVELALSKVGCHYDQGRRMEEGYYDCSSLVYRTYKELGLELPLTAAEQGRYCYKNSLLVNFEDLQPGDLIFYSYKKNGRFKNISHVAMYIGDGKMVHAANPSRGVVVDPIRTGSVVFYGRPG